MPLGTMVLRGIKNPTVTKLKIIKPIVLGSFNHLWFIKLNSAATPNMIEKDCNIFIFIYDLTAY